MPSIDGFDLVRNTAAAILFMQSGTMTVDMYSGMMSSPWSTEKFTNSPVEAKTAQKYVTHSVVVSAIYAAMASYLSESLWPAIGWLIMNIYMIYLYKNSLQLSNVGSLL